MAGYSGIGMPEIQKAYENDPKTKLAQLALEEGTSGTPVVGIYDGLARALQGTLGGYMQGKQQKQYKQEDSLSRVELMNKIAEVFGKGDTAGGLPPVAQLMGGVAGAGTAGGVGTPPQPGNAGMPGGVAPASPMPPVAQATAPQQPPPGQPMQPAAPMAPAGPPGASQPAQGAGGLPPLGGLMGGGAAPPAAGPQTASASPDGLPPMPGMPTAPDPGGGQESVRKKLGMALLGMNNPYFFEQGLDNLNAGIQDEARSAENAAERKYGMQKLGYASELDNYNAARGDQRTAAYGEQKAQKDFGRDLKKAEQKFGFDMSLTERQEAGENYRAGLGASTSVAIARMNNDGALQRTFLGIEGAQMSAKAKADAKRAAVFTTPTGIKFTNDRMKVIDANNRSIADLTRFKQLNANNATGGLGMGFPGVSSMRGLMNSSVSEMNAITSRLTPEQRQGLPGSASDADVKMFRAGTVGTDKPRGANNNIADRTVAMLKRQNDFQNMQFEAVSSGDPRGMAGQWKMYIDAVPLYSPEGKVRPTPTFSEWRDSLPKYGPDGKPM